MTKLLLTFSLATLTLIANTAIASGIHAGGHDAPTIGKAGKATQVTRTIQVEMRDTMRFVPANFSVKQGETIRFVVKNTGKLKHEFTLGTDKDLKEHYEVMKKFPDMEHADDNMLSVAPGQMGEMLWKFSKAGSVNIACLHVGHYEAGMKGVVKVAARKIPAKGIQNDNHNH
jgi:uncharacterized cupredoxin-like copper-binding protein